MNKYPFNLLTEYFIRENNIDITKNYEILSVPARNLVCVNRFDLMAKWIYIDAREKGIDMTSAIRVYRDNITSFSCGTFLEPGMDGKDSFQKYVEDFNRLIDDVKKNGFDESISIIPVGENDRIFDGAHRVATAAYYDKNVTIIRFPDKKPVYDYNYKYFRKYIMCDINMALMARQYAYLKDNCYFACIWPVADRTRIDEAEAIIQRVGEVVYSQEVFLTYEGMRNFMIQIYGVQNWVGNIDNKFSGVDYKVRPCFKEGIPVRTYLFQAENLETVVAAKSEIRRIFDIENHSIHISDNITETREMVEILYNRNSLNFINYARPFEYNLVYNQLSKLKELISNNDFSSERFIIDSDSVLEVCGLRAARDVDFLTDYIYETSDEDCSRLNFIPNMESYEKKLRFHSITIQDMLYNPDNYFFFEGVKFLSVERLIEMKQCCNEEKDIKDVELCKKFIKRFKNTPKQYQYETTIAINKYQIKNHDYGHGSMSYEIYKKKIFEEKIHFHGELFSFAIHCKNYLFRRNTAEYKRKKWIEKQRKGLENTEFSIISSNCNGGVLSSDLGLEFKSPFVNLFIKASDYVKLLGDLKGYMSEELHFVKEEDPIYGNVSYPTAYLRDVKIYFMHYDSDEEARDAWERRKKRINWDNLYILFTDRSGCIQKDLEDFDKLPYEHKVVFTHVAHPEIKSSFYIKGYENEDKVPILSAFEDESKPVKRIYDQFDFVEWLNRREG